MRIMTRVLSLCCLIVAFSIAYTPTRAADATVSTCDFPSLSNAVNDANTVAPLGGTISITCTGAITFTGELTISQAVIINNDSGGSVTFNGGNNTRFFLVNMGASLTLNGLTLQSGNAFDGGAINNNGTLTISNSTFMGNLASFSGGAIFNDGTAFIINSTFTGNLAVADEGGAIFNDGNITITNSTFTNNSASSTGAGGAIYNIGIISSANSHYDNNTCTGNASISDNGGNTRTTAVTSAECPGADPVTLTLTGATCNTLTNSLEFTIAGDGTTFNVTGTGPDIPATMGIGTNTLPAQSTGPNTWNLTIAETIGDRQTDTISLTCNAALSASSDCLGADLRVQIFGGDPQFDIMDGSTVLRGGASAGTFLVTGPISTTDLRVVELGGDVQNILLTNQNCFLSNTLTASATCNGANLDVTVSNGNAPFTIDVNGNVTTGNPIGVYNYAGPNTFNVTVREETGDGEQFTTSVTCNASVIPPAPSAPTVTVLGCALDTADGVEVANAPDNTYCRVLMKNGSVVSYSGAVPRELIGLGVILAVDVYRLQGGMSQNTFPDYARVCLAGSGRLFYMDSRNAPRVSIELASEAVDGLTCGWIPAPGTLILTN